MLYWNEQARRLSPIIEDIKKNSQMTGCKSHCIFIMVISNAHGFSHNELAGHLFLCTWTTPARKFASNSRESLATTRFFSYAFLSITFITIETCTRSTCTRSLRKRLSWITKTSTTQ